MIRSATRRAMLGTTAMLAAFAVFGVAHAQGQTRRYEIPAKPLSESLRDFGRVSGRQIVFTEDILHGQRSPAVTGSHSDVEALRLLLSTSDLEARNSRGGTVMIVPRGSAAAGGEPQGGAARDARPVNGDASSVEELIVTASKKSERVVDVPMSIVALSGDDLVKRNVTSLLEVSRQTPGVFFQDQGPGQRRITMRGVGNGLGDSPLIGLYLDEASVSSIPDSEIDLRPYDLARIEVLRGPQGTLYGEGSMAGTVRFITNAPNLTSFGGEVRDMAYTTRGGALSNDFTGAVNLPLVTDKLAVRLSGEALNSGGWIDQPAQSRDNINDQNLYDARLEVLYRPTDSLSVALTGILHRNDAGAVNVVSNRSGDFIQVLGQTTTPSSQDDYDFGNATVTYRLGAVQLLSSTTIMDTTKNLFHQGNSLPIAPPPFPPLEFYGDRFRSAHVFSEELRASATMDRLSWVLGAYYRKSTTDFSGDLQFGFGTPISSLSILTLNRSEAESAFGNAEYQVTDRLTLGGGLRYFHDDREYFNGAVHEKVSFDSVSPRAYLRYAVTPQANFYASVAKGFRSGGFNGGLPAYQPEIAWTYEAGLKASALSGRVNGEVSVYHTDYKAVQVLTVDPATISAGITNGGDAYINGIDATLSLWVTRQFQVGVNGSYNHSKFTHVDPGSTQAVGDGLDFIPEYNGLVFAEYDFDLPAGHSGYARVDYSIQGRSTYRNRTSGDFYFSQSDIIRLLDASIGVDFGKWRGTVFANNLLDDRGFLDPTSIEHIASQYRPRSFGVSLSRSF